MKPLLLVFTAGFLVTAPSAVLSANLVAQDSTPPRTVENSFPAPRVSQGIAEILKMADNGIDEGVIKGFIAQSGTIYQPTVDEIIYLHRKGLSSDLITSLIQRGAELRRSLPPPQPMVQNPAPFIGQEAAPNPYPSTYTAPLTAPEYAAPVAPVYVEPYPAYSYGYGYGYPYSFGFYVGPSFYGSYGHYYHGGYAHYASRGFGGVGFRAGTGFHGGGSFHGSVGIHGGGGGFHGGGGAHGGGHGR